MKTTKRILAFVLFLSLFISLLPPVQIARAAEVVQRYELDKDGIDVGATYLIVSSGSTGSSYALQRSNTGTAKPQVTVKSADGITYIEAGFDDESYCQFSFTGTTSGRVTNKASNQTYNLALSRNSATFTTSTSSWTSNTGLTFTHVGSGAYRIFYDGWSDYYLRYNSNWSASTTSSTVYLYKLVERTLGYNVTFDGNGYTSGTLPANMEEIDPGTQITLPAPTDLRKDDDNENTWLFQGWNTKADGSGAEYAAGETITVNADLTLYANWIQQTKYTVTMTTYLDGALTDIDQIAGYDRQFFAVMDGGDGSYISLTHRDTGIYSAKVTENGTYVIYAKTEDGQYEQVHGHKVVIYNQDGATDCLHYTITYDAAGGTWAEGQAPEAGKCHNGDTVTVYDKAPTRAGYKFLGWKDQNGNLLQPGQQLTASEKITLTAAWET